MVVFSYCRKTFHEVFKFWHLIELYFFIYKSDPEIEGIWVLEEDFKPNCVGLLNLA